jgi:hypothetical protein
MRTVSFSSDPVRSLLKSDFVCATINIDGDPTAGASLAHAPTDSCGPSSRGIGRPNVQCLFLTPDGKILHVASGYVGPKDLKREIQFAKDVFAAVRKSPRNAKAVVAAMHARRLKALGFSNDASQPRNSRSTAQDITNRVLSNVLPRQRTRGLRGRSARLTPAQRLQAMRSRQAARMAALRRASLSPSLDLRHLLPGSGDDFHQSRNKGIFASFASRAVRGDHEFSIDHPLSPMDDFLDNPRVLIGNEQTAYGSTGPGGASGGTIGGNGNTRMGYRK